MGKQSRSMFVNGFEERHDLEQYFWTESTVSKLVEALEGGGWEGHVCCLTTPSLAHAFFFGKNQVELLLDIDKRFTYLPGFRFFDIRMPTFFENDSRIVVFDPPFFYIPLEALFAAVNSIVDGKFNSKLMVGFLKREEAALLRVFSPFNLRPTKFVLEYATVKPNKWRNYALYSNVDLPGIKRIKHT